MIIIPIITTLIFIYPFSSEKRTKQSNENFKIIAKINNNVFKENTLITKIEDLQSKKIQKLFNRFGVTNLRSVFQNRYESNGKYKNNRILSSGKDLECWKEIMITDKYFADELIESLKKDESVLEIYKEYPIQLKPSVIPDDPDVLNQWHINGTIPDADIDILQAWEINKGRNDVIIAICDGGVDYNHPDLDPGDRSRVIEGYDSADDDSNPMDDLPDGEGSFAGHGTNIAGVIGAITNNDTQIAGIMWNCKLMPVKMVKDGRTLFCIENSDLAFTSDVADAIDYAVNNGAHVINLSYGFPDQGWPINEIVLRVPLLAETISNAYESNVVTVVSMGNEYNEGNPINYPAGFAHEVIAVGATNTANLKASFSSTGPHIDVSAPGTSIFTTKRNGLTATTQGTSFSAPIVSAVSGLILSQGLDRNFNLTNDDVRHILEITADDIEPSGFDNETGHGRINAHSALALLDEPNVLYHGTSHGGTISSTTNYDKWITTIDRWGLAAGTYLNVDQHEVTKHIDFEVPFCSTPHVWLRERESKCMNFANPNDGFPWAEITNITETGFDVRYAIYYVRNNILGQTFNTWIPSTLPLSKIEYTAVGEPNYAGMLSIMGQSVLCSTGDSYIIENIDSSFTISWNNSSNITRVSPQGSNPCTFQAISNGEEGWIEATISGNCGDVTLDRKTVWLGRPKAVYIDGASELGTYSTGTYKSFDGDGSWRLWNSLQYRLVDWISPYNIGELDDECVFETKGIEGYITVVFEQENVCGIKSSTKQVHIVENGGGGGDPPQSPLKVYPNPSSDYLFVSVSDEVINSEITNSEKEYCITIYDKNQNIVYLKLSNQKSLNIKTRHWKEGVYYMHLKHGDNLIREQIVISR